MGGTSRCQARGGPRTARLAVLAAALSAALACSDDEDAPVAVELLWTRECITSLLPGSYRLYAGMWLGTDMQVVLRFTRAAR